MLRLISLLPRTQENSFSIEDFQQKSKASKTVIEPAHGNGLFPGIAGEQPAFTVLTTGLSDSI